MLPLGSRSCHRSSIAQSLNAGGFFVRCSSVGRLFLVELGRTTEEESTYRCDTASTEEPLTSLQALPATDELAGLLVRHGDT